MTDTPAERGAESTWTTLRRRKVVQWGLVYVAGAWGFLQGLEYVSGLLDWPSQLQKLTGLALLIGLPVVLVLAYYHGDRGQQRVSTREFAILTLLLLLGGGAFWYYQRASEAGRDDQAQAASAVQPDASAGLKDPRPSVAVLPFENRSREEDDAFFVDGIHDDILTQLSKVSALRVISRTSVEQFRGTKLPIKAIADQLGVTRILEGGVQRAGDRVRVNVQLIDAGTDAHLWAESYDRELSAVNIFAIQSEVAAAIAGALKATLTPAEQAQIAAIPTQNLEAWQAYQLGKQRMAKRTTAALAEAESFFRKAIALDSKFALAWVGLADSLVLRAYYAGPARDAALDEAEKTTARALELEPNLAEAWASAGLLASNRLQDERAEQMLRRAIALNPNYATAHHWLSNALIELGRRDEALAAVENAAVLDPMSAIISISLGVHRDAVGRFKDALVAYQQAIEIDPTMSLPYAYIGDAYSYGFGRFDTAMVWYEKAASLDPHDADLPMLLALTFWHLGDDIQASRELDRSMALGQGTAFSNLVAALIYVQRGEAELARRHAQRAAELEPTNLFLIRALDLLKGDYATARARYAKAFPELFVEPLPTFNDRTAIAAPDLALVLRHTGEGERAKALLDRSEAYVRTIPRLGRVGYGILDVTIHTLRGEPAAALAELRAAEQSGWRAFWRFYRDVDPNLASIRNEPEFKAVFADIERDMARQRARLAARAKDAPLELADASR